MYLTKSDLKEIVENAIANKGFLPRHKSVTSKEPLKIDYWRSILEALEEGEAISVVK